MNNTAQLLGDGHADDHYYSSMAAYITKLWELEAGIDVARMVGDINIERMWCEQRILVLERMLELHLQPR